MREQKVWVEKMPRKVAQRVIHFEDGKLNCVELMFDSDIEPRVIEDIHDHDQELVRQVCEKIIERYNLEGIPITGAFGDTQYGCIMVSAKDLKQFLNQIQKEYEK